MKPKHICGIAVFATIAAAATMNAQDLTSTYLGVDPGVSVKGTFDGLNYRFVNSGLLQLCVPFSPSMLPSNGRHPVL